MLRSVATRVLPQEYVNPRSFTVNMNSSSEVSQEQVDRVWSDVWSEEVAVTRREMFSNRLFVEGYSVFKKYIPKNTATILDIGSGSGRYGIRFAEDFPDSVVYLTDITDNSLAIIARSIESIGVKNAIVKKEDMFSLSFEDSSFDVVFCDVVIQHVAHPEDALREMLRVLRPGGRLIVSAVNQWNFHTFMKYTLGLLGKPYRYGYEKSYSSRELATLVHKCNGDIVARDGFYVAYGIFRLREIHGSFGMVGKVLNRLVTRIDRFTRRFLSRHFGFEILCVATK